MDFAQALKAKNDKVSAQLDQSRPTPKTAPQPPAPPTPPVLEVAKPETTEVNETAQFKLFKRQCQEIQAELDIDLADLALLAVQALHIKVFMRH